MILKKIEKYFITLIGLICNILSQPKFTHYFQEFQFKFISLF